MVADVECFPRGGSAVGSKHQSGASVYGEEVLGNGQEDEPVDAADDARRQVEKVKKFDVDPGQLTQQQQL